MKGEEKRREGGRVIPPAVLLKSLSFCLSAGHFECPPYSEDTKRSAYHVRSCDIFRLKQVRCVHQPKFCPTSHLQGARLVVNGPSQGYQFGPLCDSGHLTLLIVVWASGYFRLP